MAESRASRCRYCQEVFPEELLRHYGGFCCREHAELSGWTEEDEARRKRAEGVCLWCGQPLPLLAKLKGDRFCSPAHEQQHYRQQAEGILERVKRYRRQGGGSRLRSESAKVIIRPRKENGEGADPGDELPVIRLHDGWREPYWKMQPREPDLAWAHEGRVSRTGRLPSEAYWREGHSAARRIGGAFWAGSPVATPVWFAVQVVSGTGRLERRSLAAGRVQGYHAIHGTESTVRVGLWRLMATLDPSGGSGFAQARSREAYRLRPPRGSAAFAPGRQELRSASVPEFRVETPSSSRASVAAGVFVFASWQGALARSPYSAGLAVFIREASQKRAKDREWIPDASLRAAVAAESVSGQERVLDAWGVKAEFICRRNKTAAASGSGEMLRADVAAGAGGPERERAEECRLSGHGPAVHSAPGHLGPTFPRALALRAIPLSRTGAPADKLLQNRLPAVLAVGFTANREPSDWFGNEATPRLTGAPLEFLTGATLADWRPATAPVAYAPAPAPAAAADSGRTFAVPAAGYDAGRGPEVVPAGIRLSHGATGLSLELRRPEWKIAVPRAHARVAEKPHQEVETGWRKAVAVFGFPAPMPDPSLMTCRMFWPASSFVEMAAGSTAPATFRLGEQRYAGAPEGCVDASGRTGWEWKTPKARYRLASCSRLGAGAAALASLAPGAWVQHPEASVRFPSGLAEYAEASGQQGWKPQAAAVRGIQTSARVFSRAVELDCAIWLSPGESDLPMAESGIVGPPWGGRIGRRYRAPAEAPAACSAEPPAAGHRRPDRLRLPHLTCRFPRTGLLSGIGRSGAGAPFFHLPGVVKG